MAILNEFGVLPEESVYRFILLDETQKALTKGWEKRLIKALDGIFDKIDADNKSGVWIPKSSPLCYYCNFSKNNPSAHEYNNECEYYSLWRPDNKTFECNRKWNALENIENSSKLNVKDTKRHMTLRGRSYGFFKSLSLDHKHLTSVPYDLRSRTPSTQYLSCWALITIGPSVQSVQFSRSVVSDSL